MKTVKFRHHLAEMILRGEKTTTWRMFDRKDLQVDDELLFVDSDAGAEFAKARVVEVYETPFGNVIDEDYRGHERYENEEARYAEFRSYYGDRVDASTPLKIVRFVLLT